MSDPYRTSAQMCCDISLYGKVSASDIETLLVFFRAMWPRIVIETNYGETTVPIKVAILKKWDLPTEAFLYRNQEAYISWADDGCTKDNENDLISILIEEDCISFIASKNNVVQINAIISGLTEIRARKHRIFAH